MDSKQFGQDGHPLLDTKVGADAPRIEHFGRTGYAGVQFDTTEAVEGMEDETPMLEVLSFSLSALDENACGRLVVAFALKQLCPPSAMAGWLTSRGCPAAEWVLATQDVHFWSSREDSSLSYMVSELLDRTLLRPNRRQCPPNRNC
jgi:hypothetical protein